MAFRFNFTSEDLDLENDDDAQDAQDVPVETDLPEDFAPSKELDISSLTTTFPCLLQADTVRIPSIPDPLYKRNFADIKFQIAQEDDLETNGGAATVFELVEKSDLVKGVYEGGFKTWECSIDLVQYLATKVQDEEIAGKKVLELGCGSGLPGIYLLIRSPTTTVDFQDYNEHVLSHVTIPNVILNTTCRPELVTGTSGTGDASSEAEAEAEAEAELPEGAVGRVLEGVARRSRMISGDWAGLVDTLGRPLNANRYDLILTSETIYSEPSIPRLLDVILHTLKKPTGIAYVAAKTIYFGVSGGTFSFRTLATSARDAEGDGLVVETVEEVMGRNTVKREIMRVRWDV